MHGAVMVLSCLTLDRVDTIDALQGSLDAKNLCTDDWCVCHAAMCYAV